MDPEFGFNQTAIHLQPDFQKFDVHMAVLTIFLTFFGLLFNILIFYVFWGMRKSASALIFLNLAAVDVVLVCLVMPYSVMILLTRALGDRDPPHHLFCAVSGCLFEMSVLCTVGFILLASADRFLGVYHHVYHRKYFSRYNLMKMILCIWIVSPMLILIYVTTWLIFSAHENHKTFTNLKIFTVCMGQYWLRNKDHVLGNVPSYLTVALLTLLMFVIVIGNLAVLKQLFRKKHKALASLQSSGQTRQRRNNTSSVLAPPILINTDSNSTIEVAKEQLKRISLAEQDMKKSDRIFQTDSNGDITGININAIMKLYIKATRRAKAQPHPHRRISARTSPSYRSGVDNFLQSEIAETPPTVECQKITPNASTVGGTSMMELDSVIEEGDEEEEMEEEEEEEEMEFELSEEDIDEELAILAVDSPICCSGEEKCRSMSISPDDEDDLDDEEADSDIDTIWKVIKFVAALKRNSKKRQNWDSNQLHCKSLCTEKEGEAEYLENVPTKRDLVRCSSDSDLSLLQDNTDRDFRVVTPAKEKKARKYSEMSSVYLHAPNRSLPYQPLSFDRQVRSPTMEEIDELVNGGELSPLVKRNKQTDLASLITMVTQLKRRSREAKQRVSQIRRNSTIVDSIIPKTKSGEGENGHVGHVQEYFEGDTTKSATSWGTLAVIAKMRSKLINSRRRSSSSVELDSDSDLQTEADVLSVSSDQVETSPMKSTSRGVSIPLNTITEEEVGPERTNMGGCFEETVVSERRNNLLTIPPSFSPANTPLKKSSVTGQKTPPVIRTRSLDLESYEPTSNGGPAKRRRGGFLINQDDIMTPSPVSSMFGGGTPNQESRDSCYVNTASSFTRRVRQSMSMRNSMNITSVTQMVYNFNKHAQKKKKEIRAAKTILILVFYYIFTLLLFVISFYHVSMMDESQKEHLSYWLTFYSYIIYLNAVLNPVIHFWRNAKVRHMVIKIICPKKVNDKIRRWKLRGGFS